MSGAIHEVYVRFFFATPEPFPLVWSLPHYLQIWTYPSFPWCQRLKNSNEVFLQKRRCSDQLVYKAQYEDWTLHHQIKKCHMVCLTFEKLSDQNNSQTSFLSNCFVKYSRQKLYPLPSVYLLNVYPLPPNDPGSTSKAVKCRCSQGTLLSHTMRSTHILWILCDENLLWNKVM